MPANSPRFPRPFPPYTERELQADRQVVTQNDKGHGRREKRTLESTTMLNGFLARLGWSSVRQVFRVTRERTAYNRKSGQHETTREVAYGFTSLSRSQADATRLLQYQRGHWGIENRAFWVRDETFGEDRCRVHKGDAPRVLAMIRNALVSALRLDKVTNVAAALRDFGWHTQRALAYLGILKE